MMIDRLSVRAVARRVSLRTVLVAGTALSSATAAGLADDGNRSHGFGHLS